MSAPIPFVHSYAQLPKRFFSRVQPTPVREPRLLRLNKHFAARLGLDADALTALGAQIFSGNQLPEGAQSIATVYAAHQFGGFVPQLGDGRAILLGEVLAPDGARFDIQLKGAGPTPYSRRGDGRAALGPVLREYIVSEAMHALGIPTTRALAAVSTGELVLRETALPGAVLTRVASSHIRVGTFQYFAHQGDVEGLRLLADHVIARHYPAAAESDQPYLALLRGVIAAQASLVARWLLVGFIHGVMNTDNTSIAGETIDYGPCAFMDEYDPMAVYSAIDRQGRYAYANQPNIAQWNLTRLAECLLPLLAEKTEDAILLAEEALTGFPTLFDEAYQAGLRRKLSLQTSQPEDLDLGRDLLGLMAAQQADFTLTFRGLSQALVHGAEAAWLSLFTDPVPAKSWLARWRTRVAQEGQEHGAIQVTLLATNPLYIPRNHLVEAVIRAAQNHNDFSPFAELTELLENPFTEQADREEYTRPPQEEQRVTQTFCGT